MKKLLLVLAWSLIASASQYDQTLRSGECPGANDRNLPINNEEVVEWKKFTKNAFLSRAHVQGKIRRVYDDRTNHAHFSIQIGNREDDTIEVIYNEEFGKLPDNLFEGMNITACGDYITAREKNGKYPPSPDGAIVHWVHMNPKRSGHPHGYLTIEEKLFGHSYRE